MDCIDWNGLEQTIKNITKMQQSTVIKLIYAWSFRTVTTDFAAPACKCGLPESPTHLFTCHLNCEHVAHFITRLNTKLKKLRTLRPLREIIIALLHQTTPRPWGDYKEQLQREIDEKEKIGKELILVGIMTQT